MQVQSWVPETSIVEYSCGCKLIDVNIYAFGMSLRHKNVLCTQIAQWTRRARGENFNYVTGTQRYRSQSQSRTPQGSFFKKRRKLAAGILIVCQTWIHNLLKYKLIHVVSRTICGCTVSLHPYIYDCIVSRQSFIGVHTTYFYTLITCKISKVALWIFPIQSYLKGRKISMYMWTLTRGCRQYQWAVFQYDESTMRSLT